MAPSDFVIEIDSAIDPIADWLDRGERCLGLWLACGVATPTPTATAALQHWLGEAETAGFEKMIKHAQRLLIAETPVAEKADALLDLMVWLQSLQRVHTAKQLRLHYPSA